MHYFTVLFKFDAQDSTEMSVVKGELVRTEKFIDEDGWAKVELASNPRKRGYVPVSFLRETRGPLEASSANSSRSSSPAQAPSYTSAALALGSNVKESAKNHEIDGSRGPGLVPSSGVPNPAAVVEGFMKNEMFYKQLMKQRQDAMQKIEAALSEATSELTVCKDKNTQLTRRLRELEAAMQKERSKWKERVDEERLLLAQRSKEPLTAMTTSTTISYTSTANRARY